MVGVVKRGEGAYKSLLKGLLLGSSVGCRLGQRVIKTKNEKIEAHISFGGTAFSGYAHHECGAVVYQLGVSFDPPLAYRPDETQ